MIDYKLLTELKPNLEKCLRSLESFKHYQTSKLIEQMDRKISEFLYSPYVSVLLAPYFPPYELDFMTDETQLRPRQLYIREKNGKVAYSVITPNNTTVKDIVVEEINALLPFTLEAYKIADILCASSRNGHTQWAPFLDCSLEPYNISQIKKLINALYYARLTFLDLENMNVKKLRESIESSQIFYNPKALYNSLPALSEYLNTYNNTISFARELSYVITHLDINLNELFHEEITILLSLLDQIQGFSEDHNTEKKTLIKTLHSIGPYRLGEVSGIVVDQMRPIKSNLDYNFLTDFGEKLPGYIKRLSHSIAQYSSQIKENEPKLNKKKLDELQKAALNLVNEIEHLKGNRVFFSLKFLNYTHIINHIITLSMSALDEIGELSESSQVLVCDKLAQLKYTLLPALFGLVDKIEVHALLKPGTLSIPLMREIKALYNSLLYRPKEIIDFKTKAEELLHIEDARFIELRLEMSYQRIDKANKTLFTLEKTEQMGQEFFILLNNPLYKNLILSALPLEVKKKLIQHYKLLNPYMAQLDSSLNQSIIDALNRPEQEAGMFSYLWDNLASYLNQNHCVSSILTQQKNLESLIRKEINSQNFQVNLNKDLIASVHKNAHLVVLPYKKTLSVYALSETIPLKIESEINKKWTLSKEEFKHIYDAYTTFAQMLKKNIEENRTQDPNNLFLTKLKPEEKKTCYKLYHLLKPYLSLLISAQYVQCLEHYLSPTFSIDNKNAPSVKQFLELDECAEHFFTYINFKWINQAEFDLIKNAYNQFFLLLKNQIEKNSKHFDLEVKEQCAALFKLFKSYFKLIIIPQHKDFAQYFEHISDFFDNKPTDKPRIDLFLNLNENIQEFFTLWHDKTNNYYDISHYHFLRDNDSTALCIKRKKDAKLRFHLIDNNNRVEDLDVLDTSQILDLYQWYQSKLNKFNFIQNNYHEFMVQLKNRHAQSPQISSNILLLNQLNPSIKAWWRNLYAVFQPYFIEAAPLHMQEDVLKLDKCLSDVLADKKTHNKKLPSIQTFFDLEEHVQHFFEKTQDEWADRAQIFHTLAQKKFLLEQETLLLKYDIHIREHYLIQHTHYSKHLHELRQRLFASTKFFNQVIQTELTPQKLGVPFPEMEDDNKRLAQSERVCALKELFNNMYHLEGFALELEKLNNKNHEGWTVYYLLQAYGHINKIITSSTRLIHDAHLSFIHKEISRKVQQLLVPLKEHTKSYQVSSEEVPFGGNTVQYKPLWYALNAFYISPKHMRSLKNKSYLTVLFR